MRLSARATRPAGPPTSSIEVASGGVGRRSTPEAERLSDWLRRGSGPMLRRRRRIVGWSLASAGALGVVSLYQTGILKHLPDPPLPGFASDRVDASGEAYLFGMVPDGLLGLASYAVTAALAAAGGRDRAREQPLLPLALAAKAAMDLVGAGVLTAEQLTRHRKLCGWCLFSAAASAVVAGQVVPEAREALRHLCQD